MAEFIEINFLEIFKSSCNPTENVFVQDGDPSQKSKAAKTALDKVGAVEFSITLAVRTVIPSKCFQFSGKKVN